MAFPFPDILVWLRFRLHYVENKRHNFFFYIQSEDRQNCERKKIGSKIENVCIYKERVRERESRRTAIIHYALKHGWVGLGNFRQKLLRHSLILRILYVLRWMFHFVVGLLARVSLFTWTTYFTYCIGICLRNHSQVTFANIIQCIRAESMETSRKYNNNKNQIK